ncbi:heterokaryon incompatibility protein [Fusarium heterosporum]|uniref:Heterokaryon incompatibility protein n=1 Tax=Fusarium heterosporum TaxID=42747 RepID=A0A8H5TKP0_FUSHE|nr:heterokaryon incompatibility protein [Fusarium heterosporum]
MKVRPVYKPLSDGPWVTRIFTLWGSRSRGPNDPMEIELDQTKDIGKVTALFAIRYNRDETSDTEEIIINGHLVHIPLSAAKALRTVFDNSEIMSALTAGWCPWFWMDCISINHRDSTETDRQKRLEPLIYSIAKWTVDCTGPAAQIKLGTNAYQGAVVNFGGPVDNFIAVEESIDNAQRFIGHIPERVIWTARN